MNTLAQQIKTEIESNPLASKNSLMKQFNLPLRQLENLCIEAGIDLPKPLSKRLRAAYNKKRGKYFNGWTINPQRMVQA